MAQATTHNHSKEMFMNNENDFATKLKATFQDREVERSWYYLAFESRRNEASRSSHVRFEGAIIVQAIDEHSVVDVLFDLSDFRTSFEASRLQFLMRIGVLRGGAIRIPDDKLPLEQYRNRVLTKEEVQKIWSEIL
jgi:hypothetical protein